jgi:hypothetical protein
MQGISCKYHSQNELMTVVVRECHTNKVVKLCRLYNFMHASCTRQHLKRAFPNVSPKYAASLHDMDSIREASRRVTARGRKVRWLRGKQGSPRCCSDCFPFFCVLLMLLLHRFFPLQSQISIPFISRYIHIENGAPFLHIVIWLK